MGEELTRVEVQAIVMPSVSPVEAKAAWKKYEEMKAAVISDDDVQVIQGHNFLKKSYWRKISRFFNLSVEIVEERKEEITPEHFAYHFKARAIAPNGAFAEGVGSCDNLEKGGKAGMIKSIHNTRTIAETRATNRAVSNLIGGGEVSAEEIEAEAKENHTAAAPKEQNPFLINAEDGEGKVVLDAEGTLKDLKVREVKVKSTGKITNITDYTITNGTSTIMISQFGKHEAKIGTRLRFYDITVKPYNGEDQYLAQNVEAV